jgi:catechol 2,3-dioxygenase-like lactoylglutathione lyase family enzyme
MTAALYPSNLEAVDPMYKRIDHVALHVRELERSTAFYESHFGFRNYFQQAVPNGPRIAYLKLGDTVLELTEHSDGAMAGFHFCLETDRFDESVAELKARGVEVAREPHNTAPREPREKGWRRVVFKGPDGEQIELRG